MRGLARHGFAPGLAAPPQRLPPERTSCLHFRARTGKDGRRPPVQSRGPFSAIRLQKRRPGSALRGGAGVGSWSRSSQFYFFGWLLQFDFIWGGTRLWGLSSIASPRPSQVCIWFGGEGLFLAIICFSSILKIPRRFPEKLPRCSRGWPFAR